MRAEQLVLEPIVDRCTHGGDGSDSFREGAVYRVRLWGKLPAGWAGNLALHACALGLTIVSGDAVRLAGERWAATFLMRAAEPDARGVRHDFLQMARRAPRVVPPLPRPDVGIAYDEAPHAPGGVIARVSGADTIGLLAEILRRFEDAGLRPRELSLRTRDGAVDDWFWLEPSSR